MAVIVCANPECGKEFEPKIHNGKYCSPECRQAITNQRVLARYYEKKEAKLRAVTEERICVEESCSVKLSRYNKDTHCELHKKKRLQKKLQKWGWSESAAEDFDLL